MSDTTIVKTIFLKADAETVWDFLTDKDKLGEWFHPAESNLTKGKDYVLKDHHDDAEGAAKCWGSVLEAKRPEKLVYTFTFEPFAGKLSTVTWHLQEVHGGTRLTLHHDGIAAAAGDAALPMLMALDAGWDAHIGRLRGICS